MSELEEYNKQLVDTYKPERFENSVHCVMPGYFRGNRILFIAQNPGELKESVEGDMLYLKAYQDKEYTALDKYYVDALKSTRGTYGTFINDIYGPDWSEISFTNVFKCPFKENVVPMLIPEYEIQVLDKQVRLLEPKLIVAVGRYAQNACKELPSGLPVLKLMHPSYLKRSGIYGNNIITYRNVINKFLSSY